MVNTYVVHIYRCEENGPRGFVGTVEDVGTKAKKAFTTIDDLWEILRQARKNLTENVED